MAKLMLIGDVAHVALTSDDEDGQIIATCVGHAPVTSLDQRHGLAPACGWWEAYDMLDDAAEYAADHADTGRG